MINIKVAYDPLHGHTCPDGGIMKWIETLEDNQTVVVGSETMFHTLRAEHVQRNLNITEVVFRKTGDPKDWVLLTIGKDGGLSSWPCGFVDYTEHALHTILGWKIKNKKT